MTDNNQPGQPIVTALKQLVYLIKDQRALLDEIRGIASNTTAQTTYPAAAIRQIQALYAAFDTKHPPQ